jgi:hypothetical protein
LLPDAAKHPAQFENLTRFPQCSQSVTALN